MFSLKRFRPGLLFAMWMAAALLAGTGSSLRAEPAIETAEPASPSSMLTLGIGGGEDLFEGRLDALFPLATGLDGRAALFGNLRGVLGDAGAQELNAGLVYRQLLADADAILGGSLYYDSRWTQYGSQFNQLGLGVEALTTWVDARANLYLPENARNLIDRESETVLVGEQRRSLREEYAVRHQIRETVTDFASQTWQTREYKVYETPLRGFDAEIGVKAPLPEAWRRAVEARLFLGYYDFEARWKGDVPGDTEASGVKGRLEVRAWNRLFLDAEWFENDKLFGSEYLLGARVRLPLGERGLNTGAGPLRTADRMSEMVVRDPQIQVRKSATVEDTLFTAQTGGKPSDNLLLDDVIFVFQDNADDPDADGSAERPYGFVQEGVDEAATRDWLNVYVFGASEPYQESVVINHSINLMGEGCPVGTGTPATRGFGRPILQIGDNGYYSIFGDNGGNGLIAAPLASDVGGSMTAITAYNAEFVRIAGFEFAPPPQSFNGPGPVQVTALNGFGGWVEGTGIYASNIRQLIVEHNVFRNLQRGVMMYQDWPDRAPFDLQVSNNRMTGVRYGILADMTFCGSVGWDEGERRVRIADNEILDAEVGIHVKGNVYCPPLPLFETDIVRNRITGSPHAYSSIGIWLETTAVMAGRVEDNHVSQVDTGIMATASGWDSTLDTWIRGNTIEGLADTVNGATRGISLQYLTGSAGEALVTGNTIRFMNVGMDILVEDPRSEIELTVTDNASANNKLHHVGGGSYNLTQSGAQQDVFEETNSPF